MQHLCVDILITPTLGYWNVSLAQDLATHHSGNQFLRPPNPPRIPTQRFMQLGYVQCTFDCNSSTGFLTFGKGGSSSSKSVKFTPLSTATQDTSFYGLDIVAINVAGQKLPISASVFTTSGAIIDSGTVITHLPPAAYAALKSAFRQRMGQYPRARALSILDTCYDFSKYDTVTLPKISFFFKEDVEVPIAWLGHCTLIMYHKCA
ncbi:Peptidase A1 [Corchorus capsularis]|uniref:Peptidase A1 n=1 Tax=Corchorus capsularis TaxID=210143 RepID=A0A1R3GTS6_COCAP|nr:Peptidase A1 [Corchorus capsularis]